MQFLDFFDFLTNSVMMPIAALMTSLLVARVVGVKKIEEETGIENIRTVATGGYGRLISENTDSIQIYDSELTLKGLQLIYAKNR